ncbi:MAG TPA: citrate synthase [Candidatus Dormibacteraeota bacterium]|jgi:citrate synthase|nr:citrate synthase [Candidatus Dormibacteraeota bacterium]
MHTPPVVVSPTLTLAEAAKVLDDNKVGAAAVLGDGGEVVGMVSERDLLHSVGIGHDPASDIVEQVMAHHPFTVKADDTVETALDIFRSHRFRHLPVMEEGKVVGILSVRHLVRVAHIEEVKPAGAAGVGELAPRGLEGVAVAETAVGDVRGEEGFFHYRGYDATELARRCSFEQVWHLLILGELPSDEQLRDFRRQTVADRALPGGVAELLPAIAALPNYTPLGALRTAISLTGTAIGTEPTLDIPAEKVREDALRMAALVPVLLMRLHRHHQGLPPVDPDPDLGYGASYLQMLTGERPDPVKARAVEQYLILTMDHGFNSSTFTSRVITSTGSDMGSALTGAIGALAGPLHGGAPSRALAMLDAIGTPDKAEEYLRREIGAGQRLMGFGHRVYKTDDPRSTLLREVARQVGGEQVEFAQHVEATALRVLNELKPGRRLYTNVEFYAGVVMNSAGIPRDMFTPTFACSRTVGWTAAIAEQASNNRLIRPSALYVGPPAPRPLPEGYDYA